MFLTIVIFCSSANADNIAVRQLQTAAQTPEWQALLHYVNGKSVIDKNSHFFLADTGYKDPVAELSATLAAFAQTTVTGDNHAICRYPARFAYLTKTLHVNTANLPSPTCAAYREYRDKVPFDDIAIVFAAENATNPSTMLGHSFLKITGKVGTVTRQHSFSYFAKADTGGGMRFYAAAVRGDVDGIYILSPYAEKAALYLNDDGRSLWEFHIALDDREKERLRQHLWELKENDIKYSFISHNCNTALMSVLTVADARFANVTSKPFTTPVEYIQNLHDAGYIDGIAVTPGAALAPMIAAGHGNASPLQAPRPTRIAVAAEHFYDNYLNVELSPVYQDLRDVTAPDAVYLESKIMETNVAYNFDDNRLFVRNIDVLRMRAIQNYAVAHETSKYFRMALDARLGEERSALRPDIEGGLGIGARWGCATFYALPSLGLRYDRTANVYVAPEIGVVANFTKRTKTIVSYKPYFDLGKENRGYAKKQRIYNAVALDDSVDLFADYSHYTDAAKNDQIQIGVTKHF